MKDSKFIVESYGMNSFNEVWVSGFIRIALPNGGKVETSQLEINFSDIDVFKKWIEYMGDDIVIPDIVKGIRE